MRTHEIQAHKFAELARKAGGIVTVQRAGTGTIYVTVDSFKARFADHGECYCREDISVDPQGCDLLQALQACASRTGLDFSRSIRVREVIARKQAEKAAAFAAELRQIEVESDARDAERRDRQRELLLARWPDYDSFPAKKRQRCRHKINEELGGAFA